MSFAGGIFFTNRGKVLEAKAQTGVALNFTRIGVGDGELTGQDISDLTALIHEVKSLALTSLKTLTGGKASVGGVLSNQGLAAGFYWREVGLFATDPDLGEILYCYGNAGALAEYIPAGGGSEILEKQVSIVSIVGNAANVSATIEQSLVYETPAGAQAKVDAHAAGQVDTASADATKNKHVSNVLAKGWEDHKTAAAPHSGHETPAGAQAKVDTHANAAAPHSGHETPAGAQAKVDAHAAAADPHPQYTLHTEETALKNAARTQTNELRVEVVSADPAHAQGKVIFNTTEGKFKGSTGAAWL